MSLQVDEMGGGFHDLSRTLTGNRLVQQSPRYLTNLMDEEPSKESTVIADLPDIDILCLQEVWERFLVEIHRVFLSVSTTR